jgi:hypothetical protein
VSRRRVPNHDPDDLPPELATFEPERWPPHAMEVDGAPVPEYVLRYFKIHSWTRARARW